MPSATIDTCCLIDLLASGHAEAILRACGHAWHLPVPVQDEVQFVRQPDPGNASKFITVPVDLTGLISVGVLAVCQPDDRAELDLFTQYATLFRSDGEAMCLALAQSRGWLIATDDRKAIRIGQQAGLIVLSSPQLMKMWADNAHPDQPTLVKALKDIEILAQFRPSEMMLECQWWLDQLGL
jgi:predicted nucleic acid-binding protein